METLHPGVARDLLTLWHHEARSYLDYIAGTSSPVVVDDSDRAFMAAFACFHQAEQGIQLRVLELLNLGGLRPDSPPWPMGAPTYNFMRPAALGQLFCELARKDIAALGQIRARHAAGTGLSERLLCHIIDDASQLREIAIADLGKLLGVAEVAKVAAPTAAAAPSEAAVAAPSGPAWHDEALSIEERMALASGHGLFEKLFAAMAQTDCTACGYDCEGYARAIADGTDKDIDKCAPGGDETTAMVKKVLGK
ncbi:MAG: hypothetical protein EXS14_05260 [Planctomycetes bacterium]|nr:hypothetical protein [Planctomycetota bacterium]